MINRKEFEDLKYSFDRSYREDQQAVREINDDLANINGYLDEHEHDIAENKENIDELFTWHSALMHSVNQTTLKLNKLEATFREIYKDIQLVINVAQKNLEKQDGKLGTGKRIKRSGSR